MLACLFLVMGFFFQDASAEARQVALKTLEQSFTPVGESWVTRHVSGRVVEVREMTVDLRSEELGRVDALNGITWRGNVLVRFSLKRIYFPGKGRSDWEEANTFVFFPMMRQRGAWKNPAKIPVTGYLFGKTDLILKEFGSLGADEARRLQSQNDMTDEQTRAVVRELRAARKSGEENVIVADGSTFSYPRIAEIPDSSPELRPTILSQIKPKYTEEARQNKIHGKVVLSVEFLANGKIGGVKVVNGLGFGLDENAVAAARSIRFRPAVLQGIPITTWAKVEFTFELI